MDRTVSASAALPFYVAYLIPLATAMGLARGGVWTWATVILVFVITPLLDAVIGLDTASLRQPPGGALPPRDPVFDLALWLWVPVQLGLVGWAVWTVGNRQPEALQLLGLTLSVGISSGAGAINVAHELMHRRGRFERALAEVLMTSACYTHFCVEHVRGHHKHVATPADPASARGGESVFAFLPRTLSGSLASAWRIEGGRVTSSGRGRYGLGDRRLRHPLLILAAAIAAGLIGGLAGVVFFAAQSLVAVLLLEIINYVEHYGLERRLLPSGRYERVSPRHSWNAAHRLTNWYLFNLQRHADHHDVASRPYWLLRHVDDSPQLPAGYASMCLLALATPLWRRVMDPKVDARQRRDDRSPEGADRGAAA